MSHILVVDDSRFARRSLGMLLRELGHIVEEAASGAEALAQYRPGHHDLVTLDLLMPQMEGFEALAKLREIDPQAKIIVTTADIQDVTRDEVLRFDHCTLINKPVDREQLRTAISALLGAEAICN